MMFAKNTYISWENTVGFASEYLSRLIFICPRLKWFWDTLNLDCQSACNSVLRKKCNTSIQCSDDKTSICWLLTLTSNDAMPLRSEWGKNVGTLRFLPYMDFASMCHKYIYE